MSSQQTENSINIKNIEIVIEQVLNNFKFNIEEIHEIIESSTILYSFKKNNMIYADFKITIPYLNKDKIFDLGKALETAESEEIILFFSAQGKLKEVKIVYRDEAKHSNLIIILDGELNYYDFVIKMDSKNDLIKKEATVRIKEKLLEVSEVFQSHKSVLLSMVDDILYDDNEYFNVDHSKINIVTETGLNSFKLTTTAIYTGIITQYAPLKTSNVNMVHLKYHESCELSFDNKQNITNIYFKISRNKNGNLETLKINLSNKFEILKLNWQVWNKMSGTQNVIVNNKFNYHGLPIKDVMLLLKLHFNMNESVSELVPELTTPSAYNFNTDEFQDRLEVVNMMLD